MRESRTHRAEPEPGVPDDGPGGAQRAPVDSADTEQTPLLHRRHAPWLLVEVDGTGSRYGALVWGLREAARREATVLAVTVLEDDLDHPLDAGRPPSAADRAAALQMLDEQVLQALAETGVHGRVRTAVLERAVFDALDAAASGADLVIVGAWGKTLLRPAVGRPPSRRLSRGA